MAFISRHVVIIGEGSFGLNILSSVPPLSLFNTFLVIVGGRGRVGSLIFFHSLCSPPFLKDSLFARPWGPSILYFFLPFVRCFVLLMIGRFSTNFQS